MKTLRSTLQRRYNRGFTLVELMVVVSTVSLFTSVLTFSASAARAKAADAVKGQSLRALQTAIESYKIDHDGDAPLSVDPNTGEAVFLSDSGEPSSGNNGLTFQGVLQVLLDGKYITALPDNKGIFYYNNGNKSGDDQVVIGAVFESIIPTKTGPAGTCRPFVQKATGVLDPPEPLCSILTPGSGIMSCQWKVFNDNPANGTDFNHPTKCHNNKDDDYDAGGDGYSTGALAGDGLVDYPADPGCVSIDDNGEINTPPTVPSLCSATLPNQDNCICS